MSLLSLENKEYLDVQSSIPPASRVLVFAPHPDDEVFGCAGIVHYYCQTGAHCRIILATSGDFGPHGEQGALIREQESRKAGKILGYDDVRCWHEADRHLSLNEFLISRAKSEVEELNPEVVLAPWPGEQHPDHRALSWIVIEAVRRLSVSTRQLLLYEVSYPLSQINLLVDITSILVKKQLAMSCFVSQLSLQPYDKHLLSLNRYRSYTLQPTVEAAEAFWALTTSDLANPALLAESSLLRQQKNGLDLSVVGEKVTVLIRSMNRQTLQRALDSVALQTYPNIEIIVLNATGKQHVELPERYGRYPLQFQDSTEKLPRSRAANVLLEKVSGAYAIFLDDDDWFLPNHVMRLVEALSSRNQSPAASAGIAYGFLNGGKWTVDHVYDSPFDYNRLLFENYLPIHAVMMRMEVLTKNRFQFDEKLDFYEDWDFWLQLAQQGDFYHVSGVSACYCHNPEGSKVESEDHVVNSFREKLLRKWRRLLPEEGYQDFMMFARKYYRSSEYLGSQLKDRDEEVSNLQSEASELRKAIDLRDVEIKNLKFIQSSRDDEILGWRQRAEDLEKILASRDLEIANLKDILNSYGAGGYRFCRRILRSLNFARMVKNKDKF